ncbi:hypothetical protein EII41_01850 [Tannerella forsythia]|uniref:Repeat protein n=2 Tax=Tannerella forsythia TaxID=28112 RepID=A0A3P1Z8X8_TANFO|nr:hypothetical protein EII41_01850 [Tannerella forsythia]
MPVKVILGDEIEYRINAVNAATVGNDGGGMAVTDRTENVQLRQSEYFPYQTSTLLIVDVLPDGLELVGNPDNNGVFEASTRTIRWELTDVPWGEDRTVSFKVKLKEPLIAAYYQNIMENKATVTTKWQDMMLTRGEAEVSMRNMALDGMKEYVSVTNSTFHQRSVCTVKFVVDPVAGGVLNNGDDQVIDYGTRPSAGVTVTPSGSSYKFKGWKHGGFTSLKPGEAAVPAASGPAGDANWYTTIDVKGDVTFTAEMELQGYSITYDYNDKALSPKGETMPLATPPGTANPTGYITAEIPVSGIELNDPIREGYQFVNWQISSDNSTISPWISRIIPAGTQGNLTCQALWAPNRFGIGYDLHGGVASGTPNPTEYTIETLPEKVQHAPTRADYTFVGWTNDRFAPTTQMTVDIPLKDAKGVYTQDSLTFHAHWHKKLVVDTVTCEAPLKLKGQPGAKSYKWEYIVSATEKKEVGNAQNFDAGKSGTYVLTTNYGSVSVEDTFKVLFAFEGKQELKNNSNIAAKIGKKQEFYVKMDTVGRKVSYKWLLAEGDTTHSMKGDSLYVVFGTSGKKDVAIEITVTLPGGLICKKELTASINISEKYNGFFVDQNVVGGREDGSSWANAYRRIEQALDKARAGDCVWVARGRYTPPKGKSYEMKYDSVEVYGGFGAWESYLHERVFASNQTILQCSNGGSSVIVIEGSKGMRWDGFIVEQGNATQGGGILNRNGQVTIANCIIRNNRAEQGGGIYNGNGGNAVIFNTEISGNTATEGAGMYNLSADPRLTNVTISGNLASGEGGGLYNDGSNPDVRNTIIWGNRAGKHPNVSNTSSTPAFSFSLIERDRAGWDVALGADHGGNVNGSPVFRRRGFDEDGTMRQGDYRLGAGGAAENQGLNRYVYMEKTRDAYLPTLSGSVYHSGFLYDLSGRNRIVEDCVDIGAYEYAPDVYFPKISREIVIPTVKGLIFQPGPGIHYVNTGDDFTFTVKEEQAGNVLKAGEKKRLIERLKITTGDPIRDKHGIKMTENEDGSVTVKLIKVTSRIVLTVDPHATSSAIISGEKVWSYEGQVLLSVKASTGVRIYDLKGQLVDARKVEAGETAIALPEGIYLVRIADRSYKVIVR